MLGLVKPKDKINYIAKWVNDKNRNEYSFFKFEILNDTINSSDIIDNLKGYYGSTMWRTASLIDFKIDDIIIFRKQRYHIVEVIKSFENENYVSHNNGGIFKNLVLRKVGQL